MVLIPARFMRIATLAERLAQFRGIGRARYPAYRGGPYTDCV